MTSDKRTPLRITVLCLAATLAACGGGGGGGGGETAAPPPGTGTPAPAPTPPAPPATPATVEFRSDVLAPTSGFTVNAASRELTFTGTTPPATGTVVVLNGTAYKISGSTQPSPGRFLLTTTTPAFEEVFERLRVNMEVALTEPAPAPTGTGRVVPSGLPQSIAVSSGSGTAGGSTFTGSIRNALATIDIDYTRAGGFTRAVLNVRGELAATGELRATAGAPSTVTLAAATPVSVAVPSSAGTLAFGMPVDLIVRNDSRIAGQVTSWQGRWQFVSGAQYNPSNRAFESTSSVTDITAPTITPATREAAAAALQPVLGAQLVTAATPVASVTVAPQVRAELSAMNDSVGVLSVRQRIGLAAAVEVTNSFPTLADCARIPLAIDQRTYAITNYKPVEQVIDLESASGVGAWRIQSTSTPVRTAAFSARGCTVTPETYTINVQNSWKTAENKLGQSVPDDRIGTITEVQMGATLDRGALVPGTVLTIQALGGYTFTEGGTDQRFDPSGLFLDAGGNPIAPAAGSTVQDATRPLQCALTGADPFAGDFVMPNTANGLGTAGTWRVVVPAGAVRFQLSVDDCVFYDNRPLPLGSPAGPVRVEVRPSSN